MVKRTFLDKSTTIVNGSGLNYGLNPIAMLNYGLLHSRILVHFNSDDIKEMADSGMFNQNSAKHILKMKNCGSIDRYAYADTIASTDINGVKQRAVSFSIIAFEIPQSWDEGIGFDNESDFWMTGKGITSTDGATWEKATNSSLWEDDGVYSTDKLFEEYEKYKNGQNSIIVADQHFDKGNEDIELDLTKYVNDIVFSGKANNGICIAFEPELEYAETDMTEYVGFFNEKTNTIYEPVLESRILNQIHDDRYNFVLNKANKIYLYCYIDGELQNLDNLPSCSIECPCHDSVTPIVKQESKGIYSAELTLNSSSYEKDLVLYDTWSNLKYSGNTIDNVENSFATKAPESYFSMSSKQEMPKALNPVLMGMDDNEELNRGEIRSINVCFRVPYTKLDYELVKNAWYRIYVKSGDKEVTIIDWDNINLMSEHNTFEIDTNGLVPAEYHVDIKAKFGNDIRIFKNELTFEVKSDITKKNY